MAYRRRDRAARGGFPILAGIGAKLGGKLIGAIGKKVGRVFASKTGRRAAAVTIGAVSLPGVGKLAGKAARAVARGPSAFRGEEGRRYRRMNAGNAKAARRAIRRIKAVRNLLQSIEKQLPKRTVKTRARKC